MKCGVFHHKLFYNSLKGKRVAKDLMLHYLPKGILQHTDFKGMKLYKTKHVTPQWQNFQANVIYQLEFKGNPALCKEPRFR